jgi:hypothetical protein
MRFGNTPRLCLLALGILPTAFCGCSSNDGGSAFANGSGIAGTGTMAGGSGGSTGSLSGSTTGIGPTTGTGAGSGGSTIAPDAACAREGTVNIPTDVLILQDKSGSMTCLATDEFCQSGVGTPSRWDATSMAINDFCTSPLATMNGVAVGLVFFGVQSASTAACSTCSCNAADYAVPAVPIAALPGNASMIASAIAATPPSGDTPTVPALQGAINYAKAYGMQGKRSAAVLLVTDGLPTGCGSYNTPAGAAQVAADGYNGTPQISTYVVGMGNVAALDAIALAGSGGMQHFIPTMGDVAGAITRALQQITGQVSCAYTIPQVAVDPRKVYVQITVGSGGMPEDVSYVDSAAQCTAQGGWYYDNPTTPTKIILCPQTCDAVRSDPVHGGVDVLYGCPGMPPR